MRPQEFDNIFLGLGGFHIQKLVLACLGSFLKESGAKNVFVVTEVFAPVAIDSVLNGGNTYLQIEVKVFLYEVLLQKNISGILFLDIDMVSFALIITQNFIIALFIKYKLKQKI